MILEYHRFFDWRRAKRIARRVALAMLVCACLLLMSWAIAGSIRVYRFRELSVTSSASVVYEGDATIASQLIRSGSFEPSKVGDPSGSRSAMIKNIEWSIFAKRFVPRMLGEPFLGFQDISID